jgi:hypothetical protein
MTAPAPPVPGATTVTLWVLRLLSALFAVLLAAQPVLAGRFLDGDYPALALHGGNGIALMAVSWLVLGATVLAWRPGRLPAWPIALTLLTSFLLPLQLGMGHARYLAVHLTLGVSLVAAGIGLALWAWRPGRARRSYRPSRVAAPQHHGAMAVPR